MGPAPDSGCRGEEGEPVATAIEQCLLAYAQERGSKMHVRASTVDLGPRIGAPRANRVVLRLRPFPSPEAFRN